MAQSYYFTGMYESHQKLWNSSQARFKMFLLIVIFMIFLLRLCGIGNIAAYPLKNSSPFLYLGFLTVMNSIKLVLLSVGLASKWKEVFKCRNLQGRLEHCYKKMVLAKMQKEELFQELREVYAKVQHMIKVHSKNKNLKTELQLLRKLYLEFSVELLLDIEQSFATNVLSSERIRPNLDDPTSAEEWESMQSLRQELRRLERACPSRGVLEAHKERLGELISWYKIQKVRHLSFTLSAIYYQEILHTIKAGEKRLISHFGNYFNQNIVFKIFGELGRLMDSPSRDSMVQTLLQPCQEAADPSLHCYHTLYRLDRMAAYRVPHLEELHTVRTPQVHQQLPRAGWGLRIVGNHHYYIPGALL
jgi:hypothetical protein